MASCSSVCVLASPYDAELCVEPAPVLDSARASGSETDGFEWRLLRVLHLTCDTYSGTVGELLLNLVISYISSLCRDVWEVG
ncbi:hypothetical protein Tco_0602070 [Tanacetum coccineum]